MSLSLSAAAAAAILKRIIATRFIYFLYELLQLLGIPILSLYLLYRAMRDRRYWRGLGQRLGFLPGSFQRTAPGAIWLHAVSVGEVLSAVELIRRLRQDYPGVPRFVSTTTLAGRALAEQKLAGLADGLFYAPLDYRSAVRRVLRALRPALVVVLETEIWPNLYREVKNSGAALVVANGRISDRALPRYTALAWFFRHVLRWPDVILAQSERDRERYLALGAPAERVRVGGNLKYDFAPGAVAIPPELAGFLDRTGASAVWVAASTMPPLEAGDVDEDDAVIAAFEEVAAHHRRLLLILAPRRPERFGVAAEKLAAAGVGFMRRSALADSASLALPGVLLLDSIGELAPLFARADVVFMGGTLARRGGHNILEPASFSKPVVVGPHMENFAAIAEEFYAADAVVRLGGARDLAGVVRRLLEDRRTREEMGARAGVLAESKRGVTGRIAEELWRHYDEALPRPPGLRRRAVLSRAWRAGSRCSQARAMARQRSLAKPVISVGGITMGGAGKTPMVAWLAERLAGRGRRPAILTRGYRRRSPEPSIVIPRGVRAPVNLTGDEAQVFVRAGCAHVGIGADRYTTGRLLSERLDADVFLLDDGFQHVQLARTLDIVVIDALHPFGGGALFPLGRLREPLEALARASVFVITRAEPGLRLEAIEWRLRRLNPRAPIFRSRVLPRRWVDLERGTLTDGLGRVAAFCGLANPLSFWGTLDSLGIETVLRWPFPDHHHYQPAQLRRLAALAEAAGAQALVTTEKDVANLCDNTPALIAPLRLKWLEISVELDGEEDFLRRVEDHLQD